MKWAEQGAGGVGGLLIMNDVQNKTHFYGYDGNGNVSALVSASNGEVTANYEYGPFGEPTRVSGIMSKENPYRFSTKRAVDFIDIILYEYRAYSPTIGRWLSRDPIGERGGMNLYGFTLNNPIIYMDTDGRSIGNTTGPIYYGQWFQGYHQDTGPKQQYPVGFSLCMRSVNIDSSDPWYIKIYLGVIDFFGGDHTYIQYVHCDNCKPIGWGFSGGKPRPHPDKETHFDPTSCKKCQKSNNILQYGSGIYKKGNDATDDEIIDCIQNSPIKKPYNPFSLINFYVCKSWATETVKNCGLECN